MVKTDYKPGDYITYDNGKNVRLIARCQIGRIYLNWSENFNTPNDHLYAWELDKIRFATKEEIIAAGFKLKINNYELW